MPHALKSIGELLSTIYDPRRADVEFGINVLVERELRAMQRSGGQPKTRISKAVKSLYREGYDPRIDLKELARLPQGTLGREYVRFLNENGISPLETLLDTKKEQSAVHFAFWRSYKLHDVLHVVLDTPATVLGEVRIVSFSRGQGAGLSATLALGVLLAHLLVRKPSQFRKALRLAREWTAFGRACPEAIAVRFEEHWDRPLNEVRKTFLSDFQQ